MHPKSEMTDAELISAGREEFAQIFHKYADAIYRYAVRRVGVDSGEDIAADTFLIAFEKRHKFDTDSPSALPWLYGIATNLLRRRRRDEVRALNVLARTGADPLANHAVDDTSEATASRVDANVDARKLAEHLARLPAKQRDVLFLHVWEQLDHAEIAAALNISLGTVRSRLSRARAAVREAHATTTTSLSARSA